MLKKIPVSQARLGMYLHALEGAWMDHPFWKSKFVLRSPQDLAKLQGSAVREVWIDVDQGADVAPAEAPDMAPDMAPEEAPRGADPAEPVEPPAPAVAEAAPPPPAAVPPSSGRSFQTELNQAAEVCNRGREKVVSMFAEARLGKAVDAETCMPLVNDISDSVFRNPGALVSLARLKTKDDYTYMHSVAVCALMVSLARETGMDEDQCRLAGMAGLLHDLGKALMPEDILNKPGKLTDQEFAVMKLHPVRGHEMLAETRGAHAVTMDVCLHHHERWDGKGYPHGLSAENISLMARMGAICDVYDAITSNRPYKAGWDPAESISRMASWKGHFDPGLFAHFVKSLGIYPTGSLVKLQSDRLAVVMEQNPQALMTPVVRVFFSLVTGTRVTLARLDLSAPGCADRIVAREPADKWGFAFLDELWAGDAAPLRP